MKTFLFVFRHGLRWFALGVVISIWISQTIHPRGTGEWVYAIFLVGLPTFAIIQACLHVGRVRLITDQVDSSTLSNQQRRRIEIPFPPVEAFDMVEAAIRELPGVENVQSARDSLQVRAAIRRPDPDRHGMDEITGTRKRKHRNRVVATISPGEATGSLTLVCEPDRPAWRDWFSLDGGTNLENAEAVTRAVTRRIAERRRQEAEAVRETTTDKELAVAKLSLLHAQVEPHFLYNTLASAQLLTRSDPAKADQMLGNLIMYLRTSLPRDEGALSTMGEEIERTRAYLEILRIRMGDRLRMQIQVPEELKRVALPPMMIQTLVENAIKHGLEPLPGGGTIWVTARQEGERVAITVADDGRGFGAETSGTGIGLRNLRERLRLAFGDRASFSITSNFPQGVAATIGVPSA